MLRRMFLQASAAALSARFVARTQTSRPSDPRNIRTGRIIPDEGYCDQPYIVITDDGNWLCVMTTGQGVEGEGGQHVVATISSDQGATWSELIDIEPASGPEASWAMPFKTPYGRVYVFYTYNKHNIRSVRSNDERAGRRVDTLGVYAFKYSDDNGRTWSSDRHEIPMRPMRVDRENFENGRVMFFWGVGKPILHDGIMYFGFAKVGRWGQPGTMIESQGCFIKSANIATERDPGRLKFELLPDGDEGLRAPKGPVSDEANLVPLSDGTLYATYRTIDGYNCHAYSRDGGHTWTPPEYATYTPGGRRIKHPRAANFVRKFSNGKFLLWFHNHGGEAVHRLKWNYYQDRNPGWISGGIESGGRIHWSQPEILLYDPDPQVRISYPDFVEYDGRYFITETQKTVARVHEIDHRLLDGLWGQFDRRVVATEGLTLDVELNNNRADLAQGMPAVPNLAGGSGFSFDFWLKLRDLSEGQVIFDGRLPSGKGIAITTSDHFTLKITLNDGIREAAWDSDPGTHEGTLRVGVWQHVAIIVDGGPKIISFVIDGILNDGGPVRQYGWGRFDPELADVNGKAGIDIAPEVHGEIKRFRFYNRYLTTSEAVGNFQAGM